MISLIDILTELLLLHGCYYVKCLSLSEELQVVNI